MLCVDSELVAVHVLASAYAYASTSVDTSSVGKKRCICSTQELTKLAGHTTSAGRWDAMYAIPMTVLPSPISRHNIRRAPPMQSVVRWTGTVVRTLGTVWGEPRHHAQPRVFQGCLRWLAGLRACGHKHVPPSLEYVSLCEHHGPLSDHVAQVMIEQHGQPTTQASQQFEAVTQFVRAMQERLIHRGVPHHDPVV
jgi:hypothetical protein